MTEVGSGFKTRLEYILDQVFAAMPDGGSHEMRRLVAEKLVTAAEAGERSLEGLIEIARQTLMTFTPTVTPEAGGL
jgi:hypothetical protein